MDIFRRMDMFLITKILDLSCVQKYMRCLSQNKSDTKLFRVYLFTVFTIKRPRALASLRSLNREDSDKYTLTITYLHISTIKYIYHMMISRFCCTIPQEEIRTSATAPPMPAHRIMSQQFSVRLFPGFSDDLL